ncbi:MAG: hypothetical protein BroJett030_02840 [Alphaproteobacteria bacterium]|nr:MAG: hypothetical protein BroJett030_02840 [Alphaproteobacteria bacterium]
MSFTLGNGRRQRVPRPIDTAAGRKPDPLRAQTGRQDPPLVRRWRRAGPGKAGLALTAAIALAGAAVIAIFAVALVTGSPHPSADASPIPLVPPAPAGVTVVARETAPALAHPRGAPVAAGADRPSGFAIELGAALSFGELSARFARIASHNAEAEFDRLEPRATLKDTDDGLEARLLVGPFASAGAAEATCAGIALPAGILCRVVPFEGELIARE